MRSMRAAVLRSADPLCWGHSQMFRDDLGLAALSSLPGCFLGVQVMRSGPAIAPGGRGSTGPCGLSRRGERAGWSAGCLVAPPGKPGGDDRGPWPPGGEPESAAALDDPAGGGEQPQPQPPGFPAPGGADQREQLGPGDQVAGQGDDLASRLGALPRPGPLRTVLARFPAHGSSKPCRLRRQLRRAGCTSRVSPFRAAGVHQAACVPVRWAAGGGDRRAADRLAQPLEP
jgi:hypothetical protein